MKCPCGCGKPVGNNRYWATEECGEKARTKGLYMPQNGAWRKDQRLRRKLRKVKHG